MGLGVADGVHSWKEVGIDSGLFSRALMETAAAAVQSGATDPLEGVEKPDVYSISLKRMETWCWRTAFWDVSGKLGFMRKKV